MIDIHNHLLYGIDDGSSSLEESLELIKREVDLGFDTIIFTPHFIKDSIYNSSKKNNLKVLNILKKELKKNNINVNLVLGNEIFISNSIIEDLENNIISTLGNSKYILIEFPLRDQIVNIEDVIFNIKHHGYIPIIAHPERYKYLKDNYDLIVSLKEVGALFQCNYGSLIGMYGKRAKKLIKKLLKDKYVDFMATDIHRMDKIDVFENYKKINKLLKKYTSKEYYESIINSIDKNIL